MQLKLWNIVLLNEREIDAISFCKWLRFQALHKMTVKSILYVNKLHLAALPKRTINIRTSISVYLDVNSNFVSIMLWCLIDINGSHNLPLPCKADSNSSLPKWETEDEDQEGPISVISRIHAANKANTKREILLLAITYLLTWHGNQIVFLWHSK